MLEANKKQVSLKSYALKIRIDSCQSNLEEQRKSYVNPKHKYADQDYRLEKLCSENEN